MKRHKKQPRTGLNQRMIVCPKTKRTEDIIICTNQCQKRCEEYHKKISIELIIEFVETHPDYMIIGEIMPAKKEIAKKPEPKHVETKKEKIYWVLLDDNQYAEVTESEIINNPADYFKKPMFEKPKDQYEVVVTIKKKTN